MARIGWAVAAALIGTGAVAQDGLAGKGNFPQSRTLSGLSGGGVALRPNGHPSIDGALTLSTPIGYTLSDFRIVIVGGNTSGDGRLRWFDGKTKVNRSNGTAGMIVGLPAGKGSIALSIVQTSRLPEDRVVNLQFSPRLPKGRIGISVGVQDLFDETVTTPDYHESARSTFVAATYDAGKGVYVTGGGGTTRFEKGFAGISFPVGRSLRAMAEHDGFGVNWGASIDLGRARLQNVHPMRASMFIGLCQGRYVTWTFCMRS